MTDASCFFQAVKCPLLSRWLPSVWQPVRHLSACKTPGEPPEAQEDPVTAAKDPEEPTTCCMSGCANCVWIQYAEVMAARYKDGGKKAREAISNIKDPMMRTFLMMELKSVLDKQQ